jgi:hypothetical protein
VGKKTAEIAFHNRWIEERVYQNLIKTLEVKKNK